MDNEIDPRTDEIATDAGWEKLHSGRKVIVDTIRDCVYIGPIWEIVFLPDATYPDSSLLTLHVAALSIIDAIRIGARSYTEDPAYDNECYVVSARRITQYAYGDIDQLYEPPIQPQRRGTGAQNHGLPARFRPPDVGRSDRRRAAGNETQ